MSKLNIFKAEDFRELALQLIHNAFRSSYQIEEVLRDETNRFLQKYIEENGVKVYKVINTQGVFSWTYFKNPGATEEAIIIDRKPVEKNKCEHEVAVYVENHSGTWFECEECGKPVKAKGWEVV